MMGHTVILFLVLYMVNYCSSNELPEVHTPLGTIRGTWETTTEGRKYASFAGIPFGKPPVGELRFEEPKPVDPWPEVFDATKYHTCMQDFGAMGSIMEDIPIRNDKGEKPAAIEGDEDCLYLNVYVPSEEIEPERKLDVLVVIHGGAFMMGSGHMMTNPKHLLDRDIIVVSINYRVGILGFLSTEDEVIPGNNGMKDQVLALRWVKDNIASFGGNPDSVTIAGVSAGGASVHLHYFSPLSKGLFARGLAQSGTAVDPWVIKENPLDDAKKLAALVGCDTATSIGIKECLREKPAKELLMQLKHFYGFGITPIALFAVVVEKNADNPFLDKDPFLLLNEGRVLDVPLITSATTDEGLLPAVTLINKLDVVDKEWLKVGQYLLDLNLTLPQAKRKDVLTKIKDFYLGPEEKINQANFGKLTKMFTDRLFMIGAEIGAKLQAKATTSPVYYYHFNYKGDNTLMGGGLGISHGDDAVYCYGIMATKPFTETDIRVKNAFLDMLYSYMTTGTPSFDGTDTWQPTGASKLTYLNITHPDDIKLQTVDSLTPIDFWKSLGLLEFENVVVKDEL